ncbi:hypothetical protein [Geminocystis herdmanii]|uniref:hypothetical protein n=1 Tax=Geminocystis herdmanii TaxID=669359 RepID=UPI00034576A6|nr:hypothetical protein [Geminocystis herdmanii]
MIFLVLAQQYPNHKGIILAAQSSWNLSSLIKALDLFLSTENSEEFINQIRWLNQWKN